MFIYIDAEPQRPQSQLELLSLSFPCVPLAHPASSSTNSKPSRRLRNKRVSASTRLRAAVGPTGRRGVGRAGVLCSESLATAPRQDELHTA